VAQPASSNASSVTATARHPRLTTATG
jgi:hypothetical protein